MKIKLACSYNISFVDYPDLNEWATTLYTLGCPHSCEGCHNRALKDKDYEVYDEYEVEELLNFMVVLAERNQSNKFNIMGGEPLAPWNIEAVKELLSKNTEFDICIYTGYEMDYVNKNGVDGFAYIKTGGYDASQPTESSPHGTFSVASKNQKVWNGEKQLLSDSGIVIKS